MYMDDRTDCLYFVLFSTMFETKPLHKQMELIMYNAHSFYMFHFREIFLLSICMPQHGVVFNIQQYQKHIDPSTQIVG